MKINYKSISPIAIIVLILTLNTYGNSTFPNTFKHNDSRQTKSYLNETLSAQAYHDAALKNELGNTQTKKDSILLSSLKLIKAKVNGVSKGGIYKDLNGDIWFVKEAQNPINEYIGSKLMDLFVGPLVPIVTPLIDAPTYTAAKLLPNFIMKIDALADPKHKPFIGEVDLTKAMDVIGLADRHD